MHRNSWAYRIQILYLSYKLAWFPACDRQELNLCCFHCCWILTFPVAWTGYTLWDVHKSQCLYLLHEPPAPLVLVSRTVVFILNSDCRTVAAPAFIGCLVKFLCLPYITPLGFPQLLLTSLGSWKPSVLPQDRLVLYRIWTITARQYKAG